MIELTEARAPEYLRTLGVAPAEGPIAIAALSGGISNVVLRATWAGGDIVVKQSLPELRVAERWSFDRARILVERDCMDALGRLLPAGSVPSVVFSDDDNYIFAMTCAPAGGTVWKDALMAGEVDPEAARRAGALLAAVHREAADDDAIRRRFDDLMPLVQGRVDPYHRTAAAVNPDLAAAIEADVARLMEDRRTLVLGDFAPKNLIIYPGSVLALDFEVAHWGDPAFDVAFMLSHLILKACRLPGRAPAYLDAARAFTQAYAAQAGAVGAEDHAVVSEAGCLLVCRVDGKSKAEYLTDEPVRAFVRALGTELLLGGEPRVAAALDMVSERVQDLAVAS
jgi:5-methylthioribose kinase